MKGNPLPVIALIVSIMALAIVSIRACDDPNPAAARPAVPAALEVALTDRLAGIEAQLQELNGKLARVTVITKFPNTPPFDNLPDPITFDQSLTLLQGMRASHVAALNWTFETDPGFGIEDKEFQKLVIHQYDQLIDFIHRQEARQ